MAVPSSEPMAIVAAIAIAPQKVTRTTGRSIGALPARAPSAPSNARKASDAAETVQGSDGPWSKKIVASGKAAPIAKLAADAAAA